MYDDEYLALDIAFSYPPNHNNSNTSDVDDESDGTTRPKKDEGGMLNNVQLLVHDITKPVC
jgi:hypothetical protein